MSEDYADERELLSLLRIEDGVAYWREDLGPRALCGAQAGAITLQGYVQISRHYRKFLLHRLVFLSSRGYIPALIDHIDGDPRNNRPDNLRAATKSQNGRNAKTREDNRSGVKNVGWHKKIRRWRVRLKVDGKDIYFGSFASLEAAAVAAEQARASTFGEFARHG